MVRAIKPFLEARPWGSNFLPLKSTWGQR
jgi:hypothetical protein